MTPTETIEVERAYKRKAFDELMQQSRIFLTMDSRVSGVRVPSEYQGTSALSILFGLDLPIPLDDMVVDELGIEVTLSFERVAHKCYIPWDAVWYIVPQGDKEGILFKNSLPSQVRESIEKQSTAVPLNLDNYLEDRCCKTEESPSRPHLEVIDGDGESSLTTEEQNDVDDEEGSRQGPPALRLVGSDEG